MADESQAALQQLFRQLDKDNSGFVERSELEQFLSLIGVQEASERAKQLPMLMEQMDRDGDGRVSFEDFKAAAQAMNLEPAIVDAALRDRVLPLFDEADTDGNGVLDGHELQNLLLSLGVSDPYRRKKLADDMLHDHNARELDREQFVASAFAGEVGDLVRESLKTKTFSGARLGGPSPIFRRRSRKRLLPNPPLTAVTREIPVDRRIFLWSIFCAADDDGNGKITPNELETILGDKSIMGDARIQLGDTPEGDLTAAIMRRLDTSGDGSLDFDEFCVALADVISLDESHKPTILSTSTETLLEETRALRKALTSERAEREHLEKQVQIILRDSKAQMQQVQESADAELTVANTTITRLEAEGTTLRNDLREAQAQIARLEESMARGEKSYDTVASSSNLSPQHKIVLLEEEMMLLRHRCESLQAALDASNHAEENFRNEVRELRDSNIKYKNDNEQMVVTITALRQELQDLLLARNSHPEPSPKDGATNLGAALALDQLKQKLQAQQDLCFELTSERDTLLQKLRQMEAAARNGDSNGVLQMTVDGLHRKIEELTRTQHDREVSMQTLQERLAEAEMERNRLEDERKEVREMRQDMEALQAAVVAQTASLTIKQSPSEEIAGLNSELQLMRDLLTKAEKRAEHAATEREKMREEMRQVQAALNRERNQRTKLQGQVLEAQNSRGSVDKMDGYSVQNTGSVIASKHIAQIAELEQKVRQLTSENKKLKKKNGEASSSESNGEQMKQLRQSLADACAEVARLTLEVDKYRSESTGSSTHVQSSSGNPNLLHQLEEMLQEKEKETQRLSALFRDAEARLQMAHETIRMMREQARVQVSVKKETMYAREKRNGELQPVSKKEENSSVTWFTDDRIKNIKTGPWQPSEDRILLQAQMQLGDDWVEIAKVLPGRTDEAIAHRWKTLTAALQVPDEPAAKTDGESTTLEKESVQPSAGQNRIQRQPSEHIYAEPLPDTGDKHTYANAKVVTATAGKDNYEEPPTDLRSPFREPKPAPLHNVSSRGGSMVAVI